MVARFLRVDPYFRGAETLVVPEPLESRVDFHDPVGLIRGERVAIERGEVSCVRFESLSKEAVKDQGVGRTISV